MASMMAQDEDTHGTAVDPEQEMVWEPIEIGPTQVTVDRMKAGRIFVHQGDVSQKLAEKGIPQPDPPISS
jgi:hypothetical protein